MGQLSGLKDCRRSDKRPFVQVGIASRDVVTEDGSPATELAAKAPSACRAWPLLEAAPGELYRVHLEAQAVSGSVPRYCLFARGPNICVALPLPVVANGWQITEGLVRLPAGTIDAALYFYADSPKEAWPLSTVSDGIHHGRPARASHRQGRPRGR